MQPVHICVHTGPEVSYPLAVRKHNVKAPIKGQIVQKRRTVRRKTGRGGSPARGRRRPYSSLSAGASGSAARLSIT